GIWPALATVEVASMVPASKTPLENQLFIINSYFFMPMGMSICMPVCSWLMPEGVVVVGAGCVGAGAELETFSPIASFIASISCIWSTMISCARRRRVSFLP